MAIVRRADELVTRKGSSYAETLCGDATTFGVPVPMRARRYLVEGDGQVEIRLEGSEALMYVVGGSGTLESGSERFSLAPESVAWLDTALPCKLHAGSEAFEVLVTEAPGA